MQHGRCGVLPRAVALVFLIQVSAVAGCSSDGSPGDRPRPDGDGPVAVTLHLNDPALDGETAIVSFGVPFPRGALSDPSTLVLVDEDGREVPTHVQPLLPWRTLGTADDGDGSLRVVLFYAEVALSDGEPSRFTVLRDAERTLELGPQPPPGDSWIEKSGADYSVPLAEPLAYATFEPAWLGDCAIRSFMTPVASDPAWAWYDDFFVGAAGTAANEIPEGMEPIDLEADNDAWLFDRTMTFFNVYVRTGDVHWLRTAHRSARYYLTHLEGGYFDLAPNHPDLKYSYGQSLLVDLMFTGDERLLPFIQDIGAVGAEWNPEYYLDRNFWTERHQTYALLAALSAWEATGSAAHAERLREVAATSFSLAKDPVDPSWPDDGCMLHTLRSHEGDNSDEPVCSPWMSALFADAAWRYWIHSEDDAALVFLGDLAQFVADHGIYEGSEEDLDYAVPWYLVSSALEYTDSGPWGDWEHSCDVAGLLARGAYARYLLGQKRDGIVGAANELIASCKGLLEYWHRPGSDSGPEWRLSPPRKFNWWFGTTSDLAWLIANTK